MAKARLARKQVVRAKTENPSGTAAAFAATDGFNASVIDGPNPDTNFIERQNAIDEINRQAGFPGRILWTLPMMTELKSFADAKEGDSAKASPIDALLRALGFRALYTPETTGGAGDGFVEYFPVSEMSETPGVGEAGTATIEVFRHDVLHRLTGALGNGVFTFNAGEHATCDFDFRGNYNDPVDSPNPSPTLEQDKPQKIESIGANIDAFGSVKIQSIAIDIGNNVVERPDVNSPQGLCGLLITERNTSLTMNPEAPDLATFDFFSRLKNGDLMPMDFTVGAAPGARLTVTMPNVQIESITQGNRDGIIVFDINARVTPDTTDDHIVIKMH